MAEGDSDGEQNYTAGGPVVGRMGREKAVEEDGGWASGKKELRIRGLMSNDGGTERQAWRTAGTTPIHAAMESDGNAHSSSSPPPLDWLSSKRAERGPGSKQHGSPRKGCH